MMAGGGGVTILANLVKVFFLLGLRVVVAGILVIRGMGGLLLAI